MIKNLLILLYKNVLDVAPLVAVAVMFQLFVIAVPFENPVELGAGFFLVVFGIFLFMRGLSAAIFPLGQSMAYSFAVRGNIWLLLAFAGAVGYSSAIAEPTVIALSQKAAQVSHGQFSALGLRNAAALGVGIGIIIGTLRIVLGHPIHYYFITGYMTVITCTLLAPKEIIGLAYDMAGGAISTISVPLIASLGIGLASAIGGRNPLIDGFGLIGFAALTPIITVLIYGIIVI